MTEKQLPTHLQKIFKLLPLGMDLPITGADMERLTGLDVRTIREHIRQLIVDYGIPVCGGRDNKQGGYYIPQNETERLLECYHSKSNTTRNISVYMRY